MKALYSGAGLAIAAGLLMGAAMKPNLGLDDRPAGPQILAGWSGARSTGPFDDGAAAYAAYSNKIPDYVVGTDWRKALAQPVAYVEPQERIPAPEDQPADTATLQPAEAIGQEPPHEATSYPSMDGGRWYEEERARQRQEAEQRQAAPSATAMQVDAAQIDDEAPPEATGDTTRIAANPAVTSN